MRLAQQIGVTVKNHCLTLPYQWKSHPYPLLYFESPASRGRPVYSIFSGIAFLTLFSIPGPQQHSDDHRYAPDPAPWFHRVHQKSEQLQIVYQWMGRTSLFHAQSTPKFLGIAVLVDQTKFGWNQAILCVFCLQNAKYAVLASCNQVSTMYLKFAS